MNSSDLKITAERLLRNNILPFWLDRMPDHEHGGFYGRITGDDRVEPLAPKGAVLNARMLWSFSAAYRVTGDQACLKTAVRAKNYLLKRFIDPTHGGVYWSVTAEGAPLDTKKQIYALAFTIYALAEYIRATGDQSVLRTATDLYRSIEEHAHDRSRGGYLEAFTGDWQPIGDMRLSDKDANERKTMNTHLHVIEAYTNLLRVWPDAELKKNITELLEVFERRIIRPSGHLGLFFDDEWCEKGETISYGHDIEAAWLLCESAEVLGDSEWTTRTNALAKKIAIAAREGILPDGSLRYEYDPQRGHYDDERHWWVQAECVVGFLHAAQHLEMAEGLGDACRALEYIQTRLADPAGGEWWWSIRPDGSVNRSDDKAGPWKCPYHNTRMCLELIERL